ncbi:helix-turn-helix domain-containing protein [Agrobacterium sp. ES01]|uniref:helix-turn-helix domain-containing protein n=1 Tax=Agrobacterium sp. ES01 TaxID=3420714 RepID=UPI003D11958D
MRKKQNEMLISDAGDDTLGGRLSSARDAAGIEMKALANQLGVKHETLQAWETDRSEPRPSRLVNLAGILGVSPMWLMTGAGGGPIEYGVSDADAPLEAMASDLMRLKELHEETGRLINTLQRRLSGYRGEQMAE